MNTSEKGENFENRVFHTICGELAKRRMGFLPECSQTYHRKGYPSRDRHRNIVIDIAIELRLPGCPHWSILWAIECKDYQHPLPVSEVEEFWAKLQQIGGVNVKGAIAVTGTLQSGAMAFAESKGIDVFRILPDDRMVPANSSWCVLPLAAAGLFAWLSSLKPIAWGTALGVFAGIILIFWLWRSTKPRTRNDCLSDEYRRSEYWKALTDPDFVSKGQRFYAVSGGEYFDDWAGYLGDAILRQMTDYDRNGEVSNL